MEIFLTILVVLAVVAVVGHGLWVIARTALRVMAGKPPFGNPDQQVRCRRCDAWVNKEHLRCDFCGQQLRTPEEIELEDLVVFQRQLERFEQEKILAPEVLEQVCRAILERRRALQGLPPAKAPATPATTTPQPVAEPRLPQPQPIPLEAVLLAEEVHVVEPPVAAPTPPPSAPIPLLDRTKQSTAPPIPEPARPGELPQPPQLQPVFDQLPTRAPISAAAKPQPSAQPLPAPVPTAPPKPPRQPLLEIVAAFLEERNIQWAELIVVLVSGLLIVGASVALVINFWGSLQAIPWLKFAIFVLYSSAIFGVGLLCFHRWKLETIGRGLMMIATLLVPLNFLAMASLSREHMDVIRIGIELVSLGIFGALVYLAGRALVPDGRWQQAVAVVGNSAAVLLVAHLGQPGATGWTLSLLGTIPVAVFATPIALYLHRRPRSLLKPDQANAIFTLLGMAAFSLAGALGLLVQKGTLASGLGATLNHASLLLVLATIPILAVGLTVVRSTSRDAEMALYRTAGTAVTLTALGLLLAASVMAWPDPLAMLLVGSIASTALIVVAIRHEIPLAHAGAIAVATAVYLTAFHVLAGHLSLLNPQAAASKFAPLAMSLSTGAALVGPVALLALAGQLLRRLGRPLDAPYYLAGSAVVAASSLFLVTQHGLLAAAGGLGDNPRALPVAMVMYALYGVGSLLANAAVRQRIVSYLGLALLAGATLWALSWQTNGVGPAWATCLAGESLVMVVISAVLHRLAIGKSVPWNVPLTEDQHRRTTELYRLSLAHVAEVVAALALALGIWTAWAGRDLIQHDPVPALTALLLTATAMITAWGYRSPQRTALGSTVALAGLVHSLAYNFTTWHVAQPWLIALLTHATLAAAATILLHAWPRRGQPQQLLNDIRQAFIEPLGATALASSSLAIPVMALIHSWQAPLVMSCCLWWLAAIWLVIAWMNRWPAMLGGCQAATVAATLSATYVWLQAHPLAAMAGVDLTDPRSLQVFGIGLALLTLAWVAVRLGSQWHPTATQLLNPSWPSVDRIVAHSIIVLQLLLVASRLVPCCQAELVRGPLPPATVVAGLPLVAFGSTAWLLVVLLAFGLMAILWARWRQPELVSALLLLATAPVLVAGSFAAQLAAASAARWAMGAALTLASAAIWIREPLLRGGLVLHARISTGALAPRAARATAVVTMALPVLALTLSAALLQLGGIKAAGPLPASFFGPLSPTLAYLVPLLLVIAAFVGFALRESSAGYAFSGGLVVQMASILGYLLHVTKLQLAEVATVIQLATITAGAWAIAWLVARRWVRVWRETPTDERAGALMVAQLALAILGNAVLLVPAWREIVVHPDVAHPWTIAVGTPLGWVALVLLAGAVTYRTLQLGRPVSPGMAGLVGMVLLGLLAASVQSALPNAPQWAYRTLMLSLAAYALFVVLATWWVASLRTSPDSQGPPQILVRAASGWVVTAGLLAVALGLKAAFLHADPVDRVWAAAAIALASLAGATMAFWRRAEGWAFAAAPGVNLAASLVVWYVESTSGRLLTDQQWWILLVQANVIASMAVALVWLAARKRLYELRDLTIRTSALLAIQTSLGLLGNVLVLVPPVAALLVHPESLPSWGAAIAAPAGWIALGLAALAIAWYLWQTGPERLGNVLAGSGLGVGILLACWTARADGAAWLGTWPAYHALLGAWTVLGFVVLGTGRLGANLMLGGHARLDSEASSARQRLSRESLLPATLVRAWLHVIGIAILILATIHCGLDPARPWWSTSAILCLSVLAGMLAMWQRHWLDVLVSGLLVNIAATVAVFAMPVTGWAELITVNILAFAVTTLVWSLLERAHPQGVPTVPLVELQMPPACLAAAAGLAILIAYAAGLVFCQLASIHHAAIPGIGWSALAEMALAVLVLLRDRRARYPLAGLYAVGLCGLAMLMVRQGLDTHTFLWTAPLAMASFALVAALVARILPRMRGVWRSIGIAKRQGGWPTDWFPQVQQVLAAVATALAVWISLDLSYAATANPAIPWLAGRIPAAMVLLLLLPTAILTSTWTKNQQRSGWQIGTLILGLLLLSTAGWSLLSPEIPALWLHRTVVFLVAAAVMSFVAGFAMPRLLESTSDWLVSARHAVPAIAGAALAALIAILVQEVILYNAPNGTPMTIPAIAVVVVVLAGLVAAAITLAVVGRLDPLRLSDRGRTAYVYAAEVLLALVGVHLRLTMPWLFQLGILERYWMLFVLAIAYLGAALSEFFHRRGLPVLSEPLARTATFLPIAPAIAFWFLASPETIHGVARSKPLWWFLAAALYGMLARFRRSTGYVILSLLVFCTGLCLLWYQKQLFFWDHPQLWLIPFALVLLVAEHLNHDRLTHGWSTALRYFALTVIYVSSTSEYLQALGESISLPIVLILLSLAGVLAGLVLRVRSFLYMGMAFLGVVIVTLIKYAAINEHKIWILWVVLILLGTTMIATFAVFQKRREVILAAVHRFRTWQQ